MEKPKVCLKCDKPLLQPRTGHPKWYCSAACRRSGEFEIRRIQGRLERLEETLTWKRHVDGLTALQRRHREKEIAGYEADIAAAEARLLTLLAETTADATKRGV